MRSLKQFINDTEDKVIIPGGYMVPRSQMPQIDDVTHFVTWLELKGVQSYKVELDPKLIKPIQSMVDRNKIRKLSSLEITKPVIVSEDMFLLDGHHRLFSVIRHDPNKNVVAIVVQLPINKLFQLTSEYLEQVDD
jgi:hypothetical protein